MGDEQSTLGGDGGGFSDDEDECGGSWGWGKPAQASSEPRTETRTSEAKCSKNSCNYHAAYFQMTCCSGCFGFSGEHTSECARKLYVGADKDEEWGWCQPVSSFQEDVAEEDAGGMSWAWDKPANQSSEAQGGLPRTSPGKCVNDACGYCAEYLKLYCCGGCYDKMFDPSAEHSSECAGKAYVPSPDDWTDLEAYERCKQLFKRADLNVDGKLSLTEFKSVAKSVVPGASNRKLDEIFRMNDKNGNGSIDADEFFQWVFKES